MDYLVIVLSILIFTGIMVYFVITYKNQRITPKKFATLRDEMKEAMIKSGLKQQYETLDDVPLMDEYLSLKETPVHKKHIVKLAEASAKLDIIMDIFDERGIDPVASSTMD